MRFGWSIFVLCGLLAMAVRGQTGSTMNINSNTAMPMANYYNTNGPRQLTTVSPILGVLAADKTNGQTVAMYPDLAFPFVYVPQGSSGAYSCANDPGCTQGAQIIDGCWTYNTMGQPQQSITCYSATSWLRFSNSPPQDPTGVAKLTFTLLQATPDKWSNANLNNGVLGLAPKSPIWTYLAAAFPTASNSISLQYKLDDSMIDNLSQPNNLQFAGGSQVTVNGRATSTSQVTIGYNPNLASQNPPWLWSNSRISPYSGNDKDNATLCIDNSVDAYFLLNNWDYNDTMSTLSDQLCGAKSGCVSGPKSNFENVDNIKVVLKSADSKQDVTITIGARDFVSYIGASPYNASFGILPMNASSICSPLSNDTVQNGFAFGLGRLFLSKAELQITQTAPGQFTLGFSSIPRKTNILYPILMLISATVVLVAITLIVIFNLPKKEVAAGEYKTA